MTATIPRRCMDATLAARPTEDQALGRCTSLRSGTLWQEYSDERVIIATGIASTAGRELGSSTGGDEVVPVHDNCGYADRDAVRSFGSSWPRASVGWSGKPG